MRALLFLVILFLDWSHSSAVARGDVFEAAYARAKTGDAEAQFTLGALYFLGKDAPRNDAEAAAWFRKAADQGYAPAQHNLAVLYNLGRGVPQNYTMAATWFRKAASQGDSSAQGNLGVMYYYGKGVLQDYAAAAFWFRKAVVQGDTSVPNEFFPVPVSSAKYHLGEMYYYGHGAPRDYLAAYMWFALAAAHDESVNLIPSGLSPEIRRELERNLTSEQITKAQRLARHWLKAHAK